MVMFQNETLQFFGRWFTRLLMRMYIKQIEASILLMQMQLAKLNPLIWRQISCRFLKHYGIDVIHWLFWQQNYKHHVFIWKNTWRSRLVFSTETPVRGFPNGWNTPHLTLNNNQPNLIINVTFINYKCTLGLNNAKIMNRQPGYLG